jgi:hypothetical protein
MTNAMRCELGAMVSLLLTASALGLPSSAFGDESPGADPAAANVRCGAVVREIVGEKDQAEQAMSNNDLDGLTNLQQQIRAQAMEARKNMDLAFLAGAWKSAEKKKQGADMIGRLQAVQQLNFISLAFLTGYPHPDKKTPASVADATSRMFTQLEMLDEQIDMMNGRLSARGK